jgi:hypothetical protein
MQKQNLHFQSEQEFQNFFAQLASVEFKYFQAVEGAGGDKGFDGLNEEIAFQVYCPAEKNRTDAKFIKKIDEDLKKVIENKEELDLPITEWVLVVPEDLRIKVLSHLNKKSKESGIKCTYWGATKLLSLVTKYPFIQDSFPTIFLPPVRDQLEKIKGLLKRPVKEIKNGSIEIITDSDLLVKMNDLEDDFKKDTELCWTDRKGRIREDDLIYKKLFKEKTKKEQEILSKKNRSDRAYELERDELNDLYEESVERTNEEFNRRGLFNSGLRDKALGKLEIKRKRNIEQLKNKFGIEMNLKYFSD